MGVVIPKWLKAFGEKNVMHLTDEFDDTVEDEKLLEWIGKKGHGFVSCDRKILKRPNELDALKRHGVGAFFLPSGHPSRWERVCLITRCWSAMNKCAQETRRPFAFHLPRPSRKEARLKVIKL